MGSGLAEVQARSGVPDVGVSLDVQVVEVVRALHVAGFGALQPLDDLGFHFHGYVGRQQGEQEPLLKRGEEERDVSSDEGDIQGAPETATDV